MRKLKFKKGYKIRPMTITELSRQYGINKTTMTSWLRPHRDKIGKKIGRLYNVNQILTIFKILGLPPTACPD